MPVGSQPVNVTMMSGHDSSAAVGVLMSDRWLCAEIHSPQRRNPNDFWDPLNTPIV